MSIEQAGHLNHCERFDRHGYSISKETIRINGRSQNIAFMRINPEKVRVRPVLALQVCGCHTATLSEIIRNYIKKYNTVPVAATNGGMFVLAEALGESKRFYISALGRTKVGDPLGMTMINDEIITPPIFDRPAIVITKQGEIKLINGITMADTEIVVDKDCCITPKVVNPNTETVGELIRVYTPNFQAKYSPKDESSLHVAIIGNRIVAVKAKGGLLIPINGYVAAVPNTVEFQEQLIPGKIIFHRLKPKEDLGEIQHVLECGPMLVSNGKTIPLDQDSLIKQGFVPGSPPQPKLNSIWYHFNKRVPRTVIGINDKNEVVVAVFEGRHSDSRGVTLEEAGKTMLERYHCHIVIAVDGGVCSQLINVGSTDENCWTKMVRSGVAGGRRSVQFLMRMANSNLMRKTGIIPPDTLPEADGVDRPISTALLFILATAESEFTG